MVVTGSDVRDFIEPVDPYHVSRHPMGDWLLWFKEPVSEMDLVIIRGTDGINVRREYKKKIGEDDYHFVAFSFGRNVWQCAHCHKLMAAETGIRVPGGGICCSATCADNKD